MARPIYASVWEASPDPGFIGVWRCLLYPLSQRPYERSIKRGDFELTPRQREVASLKLQQPDTGVPARRGDVWQGFSTTKGFRGSLNRAMGISFEGKRRVHSAYVLELRIFHHSGALSELGISAANCALLKRSDRR